MCAYLTSKPRRHSSAVEIQKPFEIAVHHAAAVQREHADAVGAAERIAVAFDGGQGAAEVVAGGR